MNAPSEGALDEAPTAIRFSYAVSVSSELVTLIAALSAAVLGIVNLTVTTYSTGRRERLKWTRETLSGATFDFVDASFKVIDGVRKLQPMYWNSASHEELADEDARLWEARELLRNSLTRIRVLGDESILEKGKAVRHATSELCNALGPELSKDRYEQLREAVSLARREFVKTTRRHMGLSA